MSSSSDQPRVFQAVARTRVVVGYAVPPDRIAPHLPGKLVPAQREGVTYVSLVGVELVNGRVFGLRIPGVRRVPAVELRVHVRRAQASEEEWGTWAVQAYVPRRLVAWAARLLYGESVEVASIQRVWRERLEEVEATYRFDWKGREQRVRIRGENPPVMPAPDARAHVLMGPSWRYGKTRSGSLLRTRVERPSAPLYRVLDYHVTVQWASIYGKIGRLLQGHDPAFVLLSSGTPVALRWRERV